MVMGDGVRRRPTTGAVVSTCRPIPPAVRYVLGGTALPPDVDVRGAGTAYIGAVNVPRRPPALLVDGALAVFFVVLSEVELHHHVDDGYQAGPLWLNVPLVALMSAPLAVRRVSPRTGLTVMVVAAAIPGLLVAHTILFWGSLVPMALQTYSVARHRDGEFARLAWLVGPVLVACTSVHLPELRSASNVFFGVGLFSIAWLVGRVLRRLSLQSRQLALALDTLAAQQVEREAAAASAERQRIAAELHDVVSHSVSLMAIQTGAARMSLESEGFTVPPSLCAAEETGRAAVIELRRALGLLRAGTNDPGLQPLPDLTAVPELVEQMRSAGLKVDLSLAVEGEVPVSLQLTAYRLLQEALTNVLKHAGRVSVQASVHTSLAGLTVAVVNRPGSAEPAQPGGHGLLGMRERVAVFGGTLAAGTRADGCYEVRAVMPVSVGDLEHAW